MLCKAHTTAQTPCLGGLREQQLKISYLRYPVWSSGHRNMLVIHAVFEHSEIYIILTQSWSNVFTAILYSICTISCPCGKYYLQLLYEVESLFQCIRCLIKPFKILFVCASFSHNRSMAEGVCLVGPDWNNYYYIWGLHLAMLGTVISHQEVPGFELAGCAVYVQVLLLPV